MAAIKRWDNGAIIIEDDSLGSTKELAEKAVCEGISLAFANLRGRFLNSINFSCGDLRNADLRSTTLFYANFTHCDLSGAIFSTSRDTSVRVKKFAKWDDLYALNISAFIEEKGIPYITMGIETRTLEEWEENFWIDGDFPNDGSIRSNRCLRAFEFAKAWIMEEMEND